jgi:hypothetical protein
MVRVRLLPATLLFVVAAATAGACGTTGSNSSAGATASTTPGVTVTTTVTGQSPQDPTPTSPPKPTTTPPASAPADAASVVNDYFGAINAHDYAHAWALGGKNFNSSYSSFVSGFADTSADVVTILDAGPSSVSLHLDAVQTDGTVKSFEGTYTVSGGEITKASVHAVAGSEPQSATPGGTPYDNCTDAHADGATSIPRNDPRYAPHLDRDNDGKACEPYEGDSTPASP